MIGKQICHAANRSDGRTDGKRLRLDIADTEFHHIVHIIGSQDTCDLQFFSLGIDNHRTGCSLEGREVTDGLTIGTCEESVAAGYQRTVGSKGLQGEHWTRGIFHPAWLSESADYCKEQTAYDTDFLHIRNNSFAFWMAASETSLPESIWAISRMRSSEDNSIIRLMVPWYVSSFSTL